MCNDIVTVCLNLPDLVATILSVARRKHGSLSRNTQGENLKPLFFFSNSLFAENFHSRLPWLVVVHGISTEQIYSLLTEILELTAGLNLYARSLLSICLPLCQRNKRMHKTLMTQILLQ